MTVTSAAIDPLVGSGASATAARRLQRLASALAVAAILLTFAALLMTARGDPRFEIGLDLSSFGFLLSATLSPIVGALIVQRRPFTRVAWLLITLGIGIGLGLTTFGIAILAMPIERVASIRGFGEWTKYHG